MICFDGKIEDHIILDSVKDIDSFKNEFVGKGMFGECYKALGNKVFKDTSFNKNNFFDITNLTKLKSDYFVFPDKLVYVGSRNIDNLVGYIMDYVEGIDITNTDQKVNIRDVIEASSKIEDEMFRLSFEEGVRICDLHPGNVLYDVDKCSFKVIDTDCFEIGPYYSKEDNYRNNLQEWAFFILYNLGFDFDFEDECIDNYFDMSVNGGRIKPSKVLSMILEAIEEKTGKKVNTLEEFIGGASLIRKGCNLKRNRHK